MTATEKLMPVDSLQEQEGRDENGRFVKGCSGNPGGRPLGARNKATETAELVLDCEAEALTRWLWSSRSAGMQRRCGSASSASSRRAADGRCSSACRRCRAPRI